MRLPPDFPTESLGTEIPTLITRGSPATDIMTEDLMEDPAANWLRANLYQSFPDVLSVWQWYHGYTNTGIAVQRRWLGLIFDSALASKGVGHSLWRG